MMMPLFSCQLIVNRSLKIFNSDHQDEPDYTTKIYFSEYTNIVHSKSIFVHVYDTIINLFILLSSYLLQNNARINLVDKHGQTPLFYAAEHGQTNIVKYLLSIDADVLIRCVISIFCLHTWKQEITCELKCF